MGVKKPPIHGRDHLPGGPDPIPGLTDGGGSGLPYATIDIGSPASFADTGYSLTAISMSSATFSTNDASVFDYTTVGGVTTIRGLVAGTYMAFGAAKGELFSPPAAGSMLQCYGTSTVRNPFIENRFCPWFDIDGFGDYEAGVSQGWMDVIRSVPADPPDRFIFRVGQNSGSSIQLHAYLQVVRIGDPV